MVQAEDVQRVFGKALGPRLGLAEASREFTKRRQAEVEAAKKDGKPTPAMSMAGPAAEWLPKFRAGAEK